MEFKKGNTRNSKYFLVAAYLVISTKMYVFQADTSVQCFMISHMQKTKPDLIQRQQAANRSVELVNISCSLMKSIGNDETEIGKKFSEIELDFLDTVEIQATLNGFESVNCSWKHRDAISGCITDKSRTTFSFMIIEADKKQAGQYLLLFQTPNSSFLVEFRVQVLTYPMKPLLRVYERKDGYSLIVQCTSEGYPPPSIDWLSDDTPDDKCAKSDDKTQTVDYSGMVVKNISGSQIHKEMKWCCACNRLGMECSRLIDLGQLLERFESEPRVFLKVGDPFLFRCSDYNNFPIIRSDHTEKKLHFIEEHYGKKKIRYIAFQSVAMEDSGLYTCLLSGNKSRSLMLSVVEKGFLNFSKIIRQNEITPPNSICLNVTVFAFPPIQCKWMYNKELFSCNVQEPAYETRRTFIFCHHHNIPGTYVFLGGNQEFKVREQLDLYVKATPHISLAFETDGKVACIGESYPEPALTWLECPEELNCSGETSWKKINDNGIASVTDGQIFGHKKVSNLLDLNSLSKKHWIRCCAQNDYGSFCQNVGQANLPQKSEKTLYYATVGVGVPVVILLLCFMYYNGKRKPKYENQMQMIQFIGPSDNEYIYIDFRNIEYDTKWEFPRENLKLGKELGAGAFGKVVAANAFGIFKPGESLQVAVKMLKDKYQPSEKDAIMAELKMLTQIGNHENIVNLLGACTVSGPVYLIFQYCQNGDLLNYLRSNRDKFQKTLAIVLTQNSLSLYHNIQQDHILSNGNFQHDGSYIPMHPINMVKTLEGERETLLNTSNFEDCKTFHGCDYKNVKIYQERELQVLTFEDLLSFSHQVAKGMEFLTSKNCIHRDLAARNVLVTHGKTAKIADFGLARDIMNDSNYVVKGNARLPVKWMPPESLFEGMYTFQSDVWSYGILLWEIFSLGVNPYPGIQVDQNFYKLIQNGFKMDQPFYATERIYTMMKSCWALEARKRPGFSHIVSFMESELMEAEEELYHNSRCRNNQSFVAKAHQKSPSL
ncbi:receptor-type tyrosine-protein kinase FLT3 [Erpetoichthys calabaricus]|uniref:receptor protein-tyrosine kinase n=1 Tax=Erpetoichthys calabaricus TaxID=27687 RepID=A0A8C4X7P7_ERPCA|nr:receptor-type tyrosine-protein kinase FLT3 [Erpetoichthys calabaricus]